MKQKVLLYALGIGILGIGFAIFNHFAYDKPILPERFFLIAMLVPVFGYLHWLRWDWAPEAGDEARVRRKRERDSE